MTHYHYNDSCDNWESCLADPCTSDAVYATLTASGFERLDPEVMHATISDDCDPHGITRPTVTEAVQYLRRWVLDGLRKTALTDLYLDIVLDALDDAGLVADLDTGDEWGQGFTK